MENFERGKANNEKSMYKGRSGKVSLKKVMYKPSSV